MCNEYSAVFLRLTSWWGIVHFFCWDSFVKEMSHFLDIRAVKEILYHSCHHHLADFTGFSGAPQTLLLSFAYRGSYNSSFSQSLTPRQTTVLHFSSITYTVCVKHVDQLESRSLSLRDAACLLPLRSNLSIINVWSDRRDQPRRHTWCTRLRGLAVEETLTDTPFISMRVDLILEKNSQYNVMQIKIITNYSLQNYSKV